MSPLPKSKIKVLIVEDSPLIQQLLSYIFAQDAQFQVVGTADDAASTLKSVYTLQPDVVTMDIQLKKSNGLELTRQLMQSTPVPIVVISTSCQSGDTKMALEIVQAGALAAIPKPPAVNHPEFTKIASNLRQTVKDMSAVKVVKRRQTITFSKLPVLTVEEAIRAANRYQVLVLGASTGGPPAVLSFLKELSPSLPVPVLLVQHIYPGFAPGLVEWLSAGAGLKVKLLNSSQKAEPGTVYLCENGYQMAVKADEIISITQDKHADQRHCPSVAHLFHSAAVSYGPKAIGIIFSGMGADGAEELKLMREKGAMTIAQDQKSSIVYGMPGEAAKINAAEHILSPPQAARFINSLFEKKQ
ncbi:MAG: response regulator [Candidatus Obscuribacterales bacterium]|jgi:two-component system chemotaxis response regulator CheB|nr:response regulator [Candidatus Obscuribacterales bacterium]